MRLGDADNVSWLTRYLGVPDSPYVRAVGAYWALAAIGRIFDPGCSAPVLVLGGSPRRSDKSAVFQILGGPFYSNNIALPSVRVAKARIVGAWIVELDNLDDLRRPPDWIATLGFVSRSADQIRSQELKRRCIFGATTERDTWPPQLVDANGWCFVRCSDIDLDALARDRDQLWAEALWRYGFGERGAIELIEAGSRQGPVSEMNDSVAVIKLYLAASCDFDPTFRVETKRLYSDHCSWREAHGLVPMTNPAFGIKLRRAFPQLRKYRSCEQPFEQRRVQYYLGLQPA